MLTRSSRRLLFMAPALAALTLQGAVAQERERADIPENYTWDLTEIFPSTEAWRAARTGIEADLPAIATFEGRLGSSAPVLADALDRLYGIQKELYRAYGYASLLADQDTRDATHEGMRQEMVQLAAAFSARAAFVEPEILRLAPGTVAKFVAAEPRLGPYRFYLEDIVRRAPHT